MSFTLNSDQRATLSNQYESSFDAVKDVPYAPESLQHTPIKNHEAWKIQLNLAFKKYHEGLTIADQDDYMAMDPYEFFDELKWGVLDDFLTTIKRGEDWDKEGFFSDSDTRFIDMVADELAIRVMGYINKDVIDRLMHRKVDEYLDRKREEKGY